MIILKQSWRKLPSIFFCFLKMGPVTFGGGYAMIPMIEQEVVVRRKWLETREVADIFALTQSIPGAVAINAATFIGYRVAGVRGAIAAMTGVLLPTFVIVLLLSAVFLKFNHLPHVEAAFQGIRAAIVALICFAGIKIARSSVIDKTTLGVVLGSVAVLFLSPLHPAIIIVIGFFLGVMLVAIRSRVGLQTKLEGPSGEKDWGYTMGDGI